MDIPASIPADMQGSLNRFNSEADRIVRTFLGSLNAQGAPETIYHYTNDVGLKGILETGKLWLTDIFDLNDPSELRHGIHQAIKIWNSKAFYGCAEADEIGAALGDFNNEKLRESAHFFTCSFSSDGDELGQWRSYADNGRGYSLGFDRQALEAAFIQKGSAPFAQTFPVQYDSDLLADLQGQIVERSLPLTSLPTGKDLSGPSIKVLKLALLVSVAAHALHTAIFFKHKAYRNEQEYRFLEIFPANKPPTDVKVRTRPYSLVRYR